MNIQLNIKMNQGLFAKAEKIALKSGFLNVQEMIRQMIRERVSNKSQDVFFNAGIDSFSKEWLGEEDEKAWEKFQ